MGKYVCGIDIGTTGVKVMIFGLDGTVMSSAYTEYPCTISTFRLGRAGRRNDMDQNL